MKVFEMFDGGERKRRFRFREEDVKIIVEGQECVDILPALKGEDSL